MTLPTPVQTELLELDELYWFIGKKSKIESRENAYVILAVSREPRQISAFDAAFDRLPERIQKTVDTAPPADFYCTDGYNG
jgi:hypothetical protein